MDFEQLLALLRGAGGDKSDRGDRGDTGDRGRDDSRDSDGNDAVARAGLVEFIDRKFLWHNAFSREMQSLRRHFHALRKEILDYTLWQLQRKLRDRPFVTEDYFAGMVVNTIREGVRHYSVDAMVNVRGYDKVSLSDAYRTVERSLMEGYVEGVNPFDPSGEWERQRQIDDMIALLDSITDPCRTLVRLKYLDGLSHHDIVGRSIGYSTVESSRVKLSLCLERMRKLYSATYRLNGEQGTHRKISRSVSHSRREGGV